MATQFDYGQSDDQLFSFEDVSPGSSFFADAYAPSTSNQNQNQNNQSFLNIPPGTNNGTMIDPFAQYLSRPPSLSPSSQHLNPSSHSPSSASPSSNFSFSLNGSTSGTDEMLFNNSFSSSELDALFFQTDTKPQQKYDQPFFLPQQTVFPAVNNIDNNVGGLSGMSREDALAMLNLLDANSLGQTMNNGGAIKTPQLAQPPAMPQTIRPQWMSQQVNGTQSQFQVNGTQNQVPSYTPPAPTQPTQRPVQAPAKPFIAPRHSMPAVRRPKEINEAPALGKHNKTERRYRQKVQAAQADLRDAVPALRVLYNTSTDEQRATTDFRAADGTVDGLGEIGRPNASAKTTIFLGARMYIELLQSRVSSLERKVGELQSFRLAVAGEDDFNRWRDDFDARELEIQASLPVKMESDDGEDEESSEEDEPKRKKAKKPTAVKAKAGYRAFAAFAMSFTLLPSASKVVDTAPSSSGQVLEQGHVLAKLPIITAEHVSRLLARALPSILTPGPQALVDWTWRIMFGFVLYYALRPIFQRRKDSQVGSVSEMAKDFVQLAIPGKKEGDDPRWTNLAAGIVGKAIPVTSSTRAHVVLRLNRTASTPYSLALLALIQPPVPLLRSPRALWEEARQSLTPDAPAALRTVLSLPIDDAARSLSLLPPTPSPITAIAEQVTLVHINDLLVSLFVRLVTASTGPTPASSLKSLTTNLSSSSLSGDLGSFDKEIRRVIDGVARGTTAHALGLVLIGLWGVLSGSSASAQVSLASALTAEDLQGVGSSLSSVHAMLSLLVPAQPRLSPRTKGTNLPANALAIDKLAVVCIDYIRLIASSGSVNEDAENKSRLERLEASKGISKAVTDLRGVLVKTTFVGLADLRSDESDSEDDGETRKTRGGEFERARESLVGVLTTIGRRAAGRATGRDDDSGFEGDLEDL